MQMTPASTSLLKISVTFTGHKLQDIITSLNQSRINQISHFLIIHTKCVYSTILYKKTVFTSEANVIL